MTRSALPDSVMPAVPGWTVDAKAWTLSLLGRATLDSRSAGQWILLAGKPLEDLRNPVLADHLVYFSADYTGTFQLYRIPIQGNQEPEILTHYRGGAFYPSVFQEGSFYSVSGLPQGKVVRDSVPNEPVFMPPLLRLSRTAFQQIFHKADRISYLGWNRWTSFCGSCFAKYDRDSGWPYWNEA